MTGEGGPARRRLRLAIYQDAVDLGGMEMSVATLLRHLDPEVDVVLLGVDARVTRWLATHRPTARVAVIPPVRSKRDIHPMLQHIRTVRRLRPDVLQVDLPMPWSGRYALLAGLLTPGTRVVAVDHTAVPPHNREVVWARRVLSAMTAADVSVSHGLAGFIEDVVKLRHGSVRVIYNGIQDLGPPPPRKSHDPPVVGTIGRLATQKGVDVFLQALTRIPHAAGVVVGDGQERTALQELAADLGIAERVTWTGWRDDARDLLHGFDVFALPSRWEGLGRVLVEAALAECPVVAARVPGTSETMEEGETGLLVPPDDPASLAQAITSLLEDRERAIGMGKRGRAFALRRFDPMTCAGAYGTLYEEVTRGRYQRGSGITTSPRR